MSNFEEFDIEEAFAKILAADEDGLLDEPEKPKPVTSLDRMERGFSEIVEFRREHGRNPDSDCYNISERRLGARLVGFLADSERANAVRHLDDEFHLLQPQQAPQSTEELFSGDFDLSLLDDDPESQDLFDTSELDKVEEEIGAVEIARRIKAKDFEQYKHLFQQTHEALRQGTMKLADFSGLASVNVGQFFVLNGILAFIAEVEDTEPVKQRNREVRKERTKIIFENGTESRMYRQSFAGRMAEEGGQHVVRNTPLTTDEICDEDIPSGFIYILRSKSTDPQITEIEDLYKIGFTRNSVEQRIANAEREPTYFMAPVEIVSVYRVYNIRASLVEKLVHQIFASVRVKASQVGHDGKHHDPKEWFVVPLERIDEAINKLLTGEIKNYIYDPDSQQFVKLD